jgi:hypothetical protein
MAEARQAARTIRCYLDGEGRDLERPFAAFEEWSTRGVDVCQAVLDAFWYKTFLFGLLVHRHPDDFIDLLAGRVWDDPDYPALGSMREALAGGARA